MFPCESCHFIVKGAGVDTAGECILINYLTRKPAKCVDGVPDTANVVEGSHTLFVSSYNIVSKIVVVLFILGRISVFVDVVGHATTKSGSA